MREFINTLMSDVSIAGYQLSIVVLIAAGSLVIGLVSGKHWFSVFALALLAFFYLLLPALA